MGTHTQNVNTLAGVMYGYPHTECKHTGRGHVSSICTLPIIKRSLNRFVGQVVKVSVEDRVFESRLKLFFFLYSGSNYTSDLKIGAPLATLPGAWRYRVSAGTGWPGVSIR